MKRIPYPNYIRRTGAMFESNEAFLENTVVVATDAHQIDYSGVVLTQVSAEENTVATVKDEFHTFVLGETGSGKTRRVILPTIRLLAKSGRSMIISDPKGEVYKKTASSLLKNGYEVHVLNFRSPSRGKRWNPLAYIEKMCRSGDVEDRDHAYLMLKDLARIISTIIHSEKDSFWENEAQKMFIGFSQLIIENCPEGSLTFENISILAKECSAELNQGGGALAALNRSSSNNVRFKDYVLSLDRSSIISANLFALVTAPSDTRNSMVSVFEGMMADFINQQSLLDLFASSEFDVSELGRKPSALYFVLPDDSDAMYAIATVFVKQTYSALVSLADNNQSGKLDNEVSFILDEFANFATIPAVESMLTAARSRGITFTIVCQSMEQLQKKYPNGVSEVLMSNCRVWIYMSCRNFEFLKRLQSLIGEYISPYTGESYPLVSISDLQHYKMGEVLVLNDRCNPLVGHLPDYSEYDFGERISEIPLPETHKLIERIKIDPHEVINDAHMKSVKEKAKKNQSSIQANRPTRMTEAGSSLIARFGKKEDDEENEGLEADAQLPPGFDSDGRPDLDLDAIIARIDEKIKALEEAEDEDREDSSEDDDDSDAESINTSLGDKLRQRITSALNGKESKDDSEEDDENA